MGTKHPGVIQGSGESRAAELIDEAKAQLIETVKALIQEASERIVVSKPAVPEISEFRPLEDLKVAKPKRRTLGERAVLPTARIPAGRWALIAPKAHEEVTDTFRRAKSSAYYWSRVTGHVYRAVKRADGTVAVYRDR